MSRYAHADDVHEEVMCWGPFAAVTVLQSLLPGKAAEPRWQALYIHLANGLYVNTLANRLVLRFWPSPPPTQAERATSIMPTSGAHP